MSKLMLHTVIPVQQMNSIVHVLSLICYMLHFCLSKFHYHLAKLVTLQSSYFRIFFVFLLHPVTRHLRLLMLFISWFLLMWFYFFRISIVEHIFSCIQLLTSFSYSVDLEFDYSVYPPRLLTPHSSYPETEINTERQDLMQGWRTCGTRAVIAIPDFLPDHPCYMYDAEREFLTYAIGLPLLLELYLLHI
jgi:hypothetical protein